MLTLEAISPELRGWAHPSPALILDMARVTTAFERLRTALPGTDIHYAVKCNPNVVLLSHLLDLGCKFEVASISELQLLIRIGVNPVTVLFSATVKPMLDIEFAGRLGIKTFSVDSISELEKVGTCAPGSSVHVRLAVDDRDSRWPLSSKFGASESDALEILSAANHYGVLVGGVSFHVGSQASTVDAWRRSLRLCRAIVAAARGRGVDVPAVNIGGGFPVSYLGEDVPSVEDIGTAIRDELGYFEDMPQLVCEPGRYLVADAGDTIATVIGVSERSDCRWTYLDVGAFNGLFEGSRLGGGLRYQVRALGRDLEVLEQFRVGGPTCDSDDVLEHPVLLPADLSVGETVVIRATGAYGLSYSSQFCGAKKPTVRCINLINHAQPNRVRSRKQTEAPSNYRIAYPGDELFDEAKACELEVFKIEGFVARDAEETGYANFERSSVFVTAKQDDQVVAVVRIVWPSDRGFKTVEDLSLYPASHELIRLIGEERIGEFGSLAALPQARGLGPAAECLRGAFHMAVAHGKTHFIASLDAGLLECYRLALHQRYVELGEERLYYGSPTRPVLLDISEWATSIGEHRPDIYSQVVLRRVRDSGRSGHRVSGSYDHARVGLGSIYSAAGSANESPWSRQGGTD